MHKTFFIIMTWSWSAFLHIKIFCPSFNSVIFRNSLFEKRVKVDQNGNYLFMKVINYLVTMSFEQQI